jgi:hypothetical protein
MLAMCLKYKELSVYVVVSTCMPSTLRQFLKAQRQLKRLNFVTRDKGSLDVLGVAAEHETRFRVSDPENFKSSMKLPAKHLSCKQIPLTTDASHIHSLSCNPNLYRAD